MATFGARDAANITATMAMVEQDPVIRSLLAQAGMFALGVLKAHEEGDQERLAALIEGVDLVAEADETLAQPGARERAEAIQAEIMAEAFSGLAKGGLR